MREVNAPRTIFIWNRQQDIDGITSNTELHLYCS